MKKLFLSIIALAHFGAQAQWTNLPSNKLTDISVGSASKVVGVNSDTDYGYWLNPTTDIIEQSTNLVYKDQVSIAEDGTLWMVHQFDQTNSANLHYALNFNGTWPAYGWINGTLANVSSRSSSYLIGTAGTGTSGQNNVYYSSNNGGNFSLLPGNGQLIQVSVGTDGTLYGIYGNYTYNNLYRYNTATSTWANVPLILNQVSVGDAERIVGRFNGTPYWLDVTDNTLHAFAKPNGQNVIDIEIAADGTIYCLTNAATNNVYRTDWATVISGSTACTALPSSVAMTHCGPFNYNGETIIESGTYTQTVQTAFGCDSVVTINVTVFENIPVTTAIQAELCDGESLEFGTQTITAEGEYTETFETAIGCDSIVTLTVSLGTATACAWENVPGARLTNISCGSASLVAGCDATGFGWHLNTGTDALVQAPTNQGISNVAICADGSLFYIGTSSNINRVLNFSGTFSGIYTGGQLPNVSAQNSTYAIGALTGATGANIYRYNGTNWALLAGGGNLDKVAVGDDGTTYGIYAANNSVYTHNGSTWTGVPGNLTHVAVANANRIIGVSGGDLVRRVGTTFSLTDLPRPNGAAIIDADVAGDGTIYVLTDEATNNVYRTTWDLLTAPLATGVNEAATSTMNIYPNPFNTEFVIETTALTTVSVMNAMGEVVLSRTINGRTSIDATTLSAGIYFVREETSGAVMKLVKN